MIEDIIDNVKKTEIKDSNIHGKGLFATENIKKETKLCYLEGQVVPWEIKIKYNKEEEWNPLDEKTVMVRPYKTKFSFLNHSEEENIVIKYFPLRLEAKKDIKKGEELTINYSKIKIPFKYKKYFNLLDF